VDDDVHAAVGGHVLDQAQSAPAPCRRAVTAAPVQYRGASGCEIELTFRGVSAPGPYGKALLRNSTQQLFLREPGQWAGDPGATATASGKRAPPSHP
jgi:hypothetical protein